MKLEANVISWLISLPIISVFFSRRHALASSSVVRLTKPTRAHGVYVAWCTCLKILHISPTCTAVHFRLRRRTHFDKTLRECVGNM